MIIYQNNLRAEDKYKHHYIVAFKINIKLNINCKQADEIIFSFIYRTQ